MVGIGGIGMSALAQLLQSEGHAVTGSDSGLSEPVHQMLTQRGIAVETQHTPKNVPKDKSALVIYSDAVHTGNPERNEALKQGIPQMSYFEALGEVTKDKKTIAVSGTHGKTTTTAMLTKILKDTGADPTAIIGSIVSEFAGNYIEGQGAFVVEACEYKDHLLKLSPEILVITNIEWDHSDHFPSLQAVQSMFKKAVENVPLHGVIVTDVQSPTITPILTSARAKIIDYTKEDVPELLLLGDFNSMNARAAKAAAKASEILEDSEVDNSLASFKGVWRRFELKGKTAEGFAVYDDYAHHPTAVQKTLTAVREKFQGARILVAFHPHLYSRTRDFMDAFAEALALADEVVLAPIYPAREEPIDGVTSEVLAKKIVALGTSATAVSSLNDVTASLEAFSKDYKLTSNNCIFITMGAGDIYRVADALTTS